MKGVKKDKITSIMAHIKLNNKDSEGMQYSSIHQNDREGHTGIEGSEEESDSDEGSEDEVVAFVESCDESETDEEDISDAKSDEEMLFVITEAVTSRSGRRCRPSTWYQEGWIA